VCAPGFLEAAGKPIGVPLRDDILKFVAAETRGQYFGEGELDELVQFLQNEGMSAVPEGTTFSEAQRRDTGELFLIPATLALFGLLGLNANIHWK
jgi:hypothetical protein